MDIRYALRNGENIYTLPLRVCYYARVSTDSVEQSSSIVNQVSYFEKYINDIKSWTLTKGYIDEGISGKDVCKREQFLKMIEDAKSDKFDLILTKSVSRFARNTMDSIYYTNLLLEYKVGVIFINDNINTFNSDSEFRLTLMASIAQDELRKLSESVRFGLKQSINRGVVLGSSNILGYKKNNGMLEIIDREAVIVRDIYNLFLLNTHNYSEIARIINDKYDRKLNSSSIKRILTNYKYKGYYCGKKSEVIDYKRSKRRLFKEDEWVIYKDGSIPSIVEEGVWDRVNEFIKKKNTYKEICKNEVYCKRHGKVVSKHKYYKDKCYVYYVCNSCFRISKRLLDNIIDNRYVKRIIVLNRENDLKIDVMY